MRKKNTMFRRKKLVSSRRRQMSKQLHRKLANRRQRYQIQMDSESLCDITVADIDSTTFEVKTANPAGTEAL